MPIPPTPPASRRPFGRGRLAMLAAALLVATAVPLLVSAELAKDREVSVTVPGEMTIYQIRALYNDRNYRDAYAAARAVALNADRTDEDRAAAIPWYLQSTDRLSYRTVFDAFRPEVLAAQPGPKLQIAIADAMLGLRHGGMIIEGAFQRGTYNRGGMQIETADADRLTSLRLLVPMLAEAGGDIDGQSRDREDLLRALREALMHNRADEEWQFKSYGWRLLSLTDLTEEPDYTNPDRHPAVNGRQGVPIDADGNPAAFAVPESWDAAANDGERLRWVEAELDKVTGNDDRFERAMEYADLMRAWYGVENLSAYQSQIADAIAEAAEDDAPISEADGLLMLPSLSDEETIAKLATGLKRMPLPPEANFIATYKRLLGETMNVSATNVYGAYRRLAEVYLDRMQFPRAAQVYRDYLAIPADRMAGDPNLLRVLRGRATEAIGEIVDPAGMLTAEGTQSAGRPAEMELRFRNATAVSFTAHELDVPRFLADVKRTLRSGSTKAREELILNPEEIASTLFNDLPNEHRRRMEPYRGKQVASWSMKLDPAADHFDRTVPVATPLRDGGAFIVTATLRGDGADSPTHTVVHVLWTSELAIVGKPLVDGMLYFVADSLTGQAVPNATLDLFGYEVARYRRNTNQTPVVNVARGAATTDANGLAKVTFRQLGVDDDRDHEWLIEATSPSKQYGWHGWENFSWADDREDDWRNLVAFGVSDRPIYRPGHTVKFHVWSGIAKYGAVKTFAGRKEEFDIIDPTGERVATVEAIYDTFGGAGGQFTLADDAKLGNYAIRKSTEFTRNALNFRVEEYRRPEFEVSVKTPPETPMLGDTVPITVRASYYAGGPVSQGTASIKITRKLDDSAWYPAQRWDWLFGRGYGFEGFVFGSRHPRGWHAQPDELVVDTEVPLDANGEATVQVETAVARELYGEGTHRYSVQADVTDLSRRVQSGGGSVLVSSAPFTARVWNRGGYGREAEPSEFTISARRPDQSPIASGTAEVQLVRLAAEGERIAGAAEVVVQTVSVPIDDGTADVELTPRRAGIHEVRATVSVEGQPAQTDVRTFLVRGDQLASTRLPTPSLTVTADRHTYKVGDTASLLITTPGDDVTVLGWKIADRDYYAAPVVSKLNGTARSMTIAIEEADQPNRFVEVLCVYDSQLLVESVPLLVPPDEKALNVEVTAGKAEYRPGETADVTVTVTDGDGKPVQTALAVAAYDRSVDAVAGGPDSRDIREAFWKWTRNHYARSQDNLSRSDYGSLYPPGSRSFSTLGAFGDLTDVIVATRRKSRGLAEAAPRMLKTSPAGGGGFGGGIGGAMGGGGGGFFGGGAMEDAAEVTAAPMAAPVADEFGMAGRAMAKSGEAPGEPAPTVAVRENFADTALWTTALLTDSDGRATTQVTWPDNLSDWSLRAWGVAASLRVGQAQSSARTSKDLLVRLQTPRFLTQTDTVLLSATVQNKGAADRVCVVRFETDGPVTSLDEAAASQTITVPAGQQTRAEYRVRAVAAGSLDVAVTAYSAAEGDLPEESDGMKLSLPVQVHGMEKVESWAGAIRDGSRTITFTVPEQRQPEQTRLEVRVSPSIAGSVVDALPYLAEYPYGCTEQTLNRFLPAVVVRRTLDDLGLDLGQLSKSRLNPEARDDAEGNPGTEAWKRLPKRKGEEPPVFDDDTVDEMVAAGVSRLAQMQLSDGGWGWFSGFGEYASPHTTAVVVNGLQQAAAADVALPGGMLEDGEAWLRRHRSEQLVALRNHDWNVKNQALINDDEAKRRSPSKAHADTLDALVQLLLTRKEEETSKDTAAMHEYLYRDRSRLAPYGVALLGLSLHNVDAGDDRIAMIVRNLDQYLVIDDENDTAYLDTPETYRWWYWYADEVEANAWALKLFVRVRPDDARTGGLASYLLKNRRHGTYWKSTRDTALAVGALADYLAATGELDADLTATLLVDGQPAKTVRMTRQNLLTFDGTLVIEGLDLAAGEHTLELRREGTGTLYYGVSLANFTMEDFITKAGLETRVRRTLWHLTPREAAVDVAGAGNAPVSMKYEAYDRTELQPGQSLGSGELIEVELTVETKNDYEYLVVEDFKPAGCEPVNPVSGYRRGAYVEFRDNRTALFLRSMPRGTQSLRYRLRTEQPGDYSGLPAVIRAMYAPELRGNSDEVKLRVEAGE